MIPSSNLENTNIPPKIIDQAIEIALSGQLQDSISLFENYGLNIEKLDAIFNIFISFESDQPLTEFQELKDYVMQVLKPEENKSLPQVMQKLNQATFFNRQSKGELSRSKKFDETKFESFDFKPTLLNLFSFIPPDTWHSHILPQFDFGCISEWRCISKCMNQVCLSYFSKNAQFKHPCYLVDTGKGELPSINKYKVMTWVNELGHLVYNDAGFTCLIMREGLTLNKMMQEAEGLQLSLRICEDVLQNYGNTPVEQTYAVFITNHIFTDSMWSSDFDNVRHQEKCVDQNGCKVPTIQELSALYVSSKDDVQNILYQTLSRSTFAYSSTYFKDAKIPLCMTFARQVLNPSKIRAHAAFSDKVHPWDGSGGKRHL